SAGGQVVVENHMGTNPGEARAVGQDFIPLALDMAPVQPHTTQARARSCESCHANGRSLGLGGPYPINSLGQGEASFVEWDGSRILDDRGRQGITVGSHWPLSRGLNGKEVDGILRTGTCLGCHGIMDGKWGSKGVLDSRGHGKMVEKILRSSRVPRE
ncbi:MAG: hypothetical protein MI749_07955, partial [Desulfovibrionales bacterium]|nr:hypothetical protein [Desulfovibrionales bacterium]